MTEIETIKELKEYAENSWGDLNESFELSIKALEKQIAKKPIYPTISRDMATYCPTCNKFVCFRDTSRFKYCQTCGQKLDWSEEDDRTGSN